MPITRTDLRKVAVGLALATALAIALVVTWSKATVNAHATARHDYASEIMEAQTDWGRPYVANIVARGDNLFTGYSMGVNGFAHHTLRMVTITYVSDGQPRRSDIVLSFNQAEPDQALVWFYQGQHDSAFATTLHSQVNPWDYIHYYSPPIENTIAQLFVLWFTTWLGLWLWIAIGGVVAAYKIPWHKLRQHLPGGALAS